jgi:tetratricopeptide (TPR) repeat protein
VTEHRVHLARVVASIIAIVFVACRPSPEQPAARAKPLTISLPDLSGMEPSVQQQMRDAFASMTMKREDPSTPQAVLGRAYGEMGNLLLAAEYVDAAEPCFLNAELLVPSEIRWPYFLGHVYRTRGEPAKAAAAFERALKLGPTDLAALVWLGVVNLDLGRPEAAEALFVRALSEQPQSVAALVGRGRAALAQREYGRAVDELERALALDPRASMARYPLGLAYRGLGDAARAEANLRQRGGVEVGPADPLMQELSTLLQSAVSYETRGVRALEGGEWTAAAGLFRKGLELAPNSASLHHKLGTVLSLGGDNRAAVEQFLEALRLNPGFAQAHYSLGVMMATGGRIPEAIAQFSAAVRDEPNYVEARLQLAEALRRSGRPDQALPHYAKVVAIDSRSPDARMGYASSLVALRRFDDAREQLNEGMKLFPERPEFAQALDRLRAIAGQR